ncbi:YidC/Oxa1 family insertase periplasmic-domain containing protein [Brachyspira innocens]|uniref:Membrane protein insertase YidC n=1 Tax=Brachyspira innocens TaxID=13264 RepID=A0ABT8YTY5_9SPIR|nr:YidC/Oxa1 family insertase periplasmic-domain containing protein [Brachyspira innocens]MDO6992970.1 YidC/Oxa1 family insertase periplasmic-domain containing protein [Brachyspira innocens]MDO7019221.1 YidC/Oxa1 family insertase periplasmic-domain containing protein [Brachyspira innocens]
MSNNKRMVIAFALTAIILFVYMFYQSKVMKPVYSSNTNTNSTVASNNIENNNNTANYLLDTAQMQNFAKIEDTNALPLNNEKILENEYVIASFKNGSLFSYKLKNYYPQDLGRDATNEIIDMVEQVYEGIYPFTVTFQNLSNSIAMPENLNYQLISNENNDLVSYSALALIDNVPVRITKTFSFGEDPYQLKNSVTIENIGEKDLSLFYSYFLATGIGPYRTDKNSVREDATRAQYLIKGNGKSKILLTGDIVKDNIFSRLFGSSSRGIKTNQMRYSVYEGQDKWAALNNRYFAIISSSAQPDNTVFETMTFSKPSTNEYRNDFHLANLVSKHSIKSGSSITDTYSVFMGPKVRRLFSKYYVEESYESIFQESFLGINLRPLTYILDIMLNGLYNITKNYAWAILLFTLLFKIVTFPLNNASYKSMKRMQLVNPKIERIREQYKDNPDKLNAEIMAIYKKEKINPLGGCLPMLLPFPLLIAFFYLMQSMVELRNTPFLWITDLSSPDRLFVFPAGLPILGGFNFNLFPILMAITSYLSMKLQPSSSAGGSSSAAAQMKMMTTIFPLMMLLMFYNFASGLALYWTAQNVFGVAQQFITSKLDKSSNDIIEEEETKITTKKKKRKKK